MASIEKLIKPASVAVIGASNSPEKIGFQVFDNLLKAGYLGNVYPINPKGGEILGHQVFTNIKEIGEEIDLAIIVIPSVFVKDTVADCISASVKSLIVITAGFSEVGEDGKRLQDEITEMCNQANVPLLGPNCLGLINTNWALNASFAKTMPNTGNVSFVSQSGAMVSALIDWSKSTSVGFSKIFSMGNKAVLSEADILEYLYNDDDTKVVVCYMEQMKVTDALTSIFKQYAKTKPTVVLFGGKSEEGGKAAASHTGSIVSSYLSVSTYLKQAGVILADDLNDLFTYTTVFSRYQAINGKNIAIITNAGGPSIAASDSIIANGLKLAKISDEVVEKLHQALRPEAPVHNPIDVLGDANEVEYQKALEIAATADEIDGMLVLLTPQSSTKIIETAEVITNLVTDKPIIASFVGGELVKESRNLMESKNVICFDYPEIGVKAFRALNNFASSKIELETKQKSDQVFEMENKEDIIESFGLPVLRYFEINNEQELFDAVAKIGYPIVLKTARKDISHKSDAGGVKLNIQNDDQLREAFAEVGAPAIVGKMVKGKHEIFLGAKKDSNVGTTIAFGTGGIYAEIYKDLSYRVSPLTHEMALEMISETHMGEILSGARGQKAYDLDKLAGIIVNAAKFIDTFSNITELDFNPMMADESDFYLVDARIITE